MLVAVGLHTLEGVVTQDASIDKKISGVCSVDESTHAGATFEVVDGAFFCRVSALNSPCPRRRRSTSVSA